MRLWLVIETMWSICDRETDRLMSSDQIHCFLFQNVVLNGSKRVKYCGVLPKNFCKQTLIKNWYIIRENYALCVNISRYHGTTFGWENWNNQTKILSSATKTNSGSNVHL